MNEKFKLLAVLAGFNLWQDEEWNPGDVVDWSCRYDDELEKFAELIVKDCIDKVKMYELDSRNHISYMLKRYYGVEE